MNYVQMILSLSSHFGWEVHQMDAKRYFLHGDLNEEIYMEKNPKFKKNEIFIYQLKKTLCGLKQTPREWYEKIDNFFLYLSFETFGWKIIPWVEFPPIGWNFCIGALV
jgi:hypothetical protein